ncbi:MAG TPA: hypothetical protein VMB72_08920 [Acidimicrobiales bacterium]|nr:hypothetical protein [Acidimicrobiales bacterium]
MTTLRLRRVALERWLIEAEELLHQVAPAATLEATHPPGPAQDGPHQRAPAA